MKNVYRDGKRSPALTLKTYLRDGETVLWTGTPYENASYRPPLVFIFGVLFWLGFVIWAGCSRLRESPSCWLAA